MILSGRSFEYALKNGFWKAFREDKPIQAEDLHIGPNSVDVSLSKFFTRVYVKDRRCRQFYIDPHDHDTMSIQYQEADHVILYPGTLLLGRTQEHFETNTPIWMERYKGKISFVQMYDGRSTLARLGIISHCTAGFGDLGYNRPWTLELANLGNDAVMLRAGDRIGQISFHSVCGDLTYSYNGAYKDQSKYPQAPSLGKGRL